MVFLFSGAVQSIAPVHFMAQVIASLPFLFLVTRWFLDRPSWRRTAVLASTYAVASLASFPPLLLPSFVFVALYFCCVVAVEKRSAWRPFALRYVIGVGLSFGMVAVYYVPTIMNILHTEHATTAYRHAGLGFLSAQAAFGLISPTANGGAGIYLTPLVGGLSGGLSYVGVTALVLAIFSIAKTNRRVAALILTCGGCAVLALLKVFGVRPIQWIALLPGFQNIHYSHYLGIPLAFLISILSGAGLDHLLRKVIGLWSLALAAVALAALLASLWLFMRGAGNFDQPDAWRWVVSYRIAALFALAAVAESVLAYFGHRTRWGRTAGWALLALVFFEGLRNATYPRQRRWGAFSHPPAFVSFLQQMPAGSRGFEVGLFRANSGSAFGIDQLDSLYAFFSSRMHELYVTYAGTTDPLFMRGGSKIPPESVLDRAGINWILINPFLRAMLSELAARNYPAIFDQNGLKIFGRSTARRQLFSSEYQVMDRAAALKSIATAPSSVVVLEAQPPFPPVPNRADDPAPEVISARLNSMEYRVHAPRPGLLYVADAWAQGWSATVNGNATPIFIANYAFRAVAIPEGEVRVRFSYLPVGLIPGLAVSIISIGIVVILLRRRKGAAESQPTLSP